MHVNPSHQWTILDAVLCMQLSIDLHGTEDKMRQCLSNLEAVPYGEGYTHLPERMVELSDTANVVAEVNSVCNNYYKAFCDSMDQYEEVVDDPVIEEKAFA